MQISRLMVANEWIDPKLMIAGRFTTKKDTSVTFWAERKKFLSYL